MSDSPSRNAGPFPAPSIQEQPDLPLEERDQPWNEGLTPKIWEKHEEFVYNSAYHLLGKDLHSADRVTEQVLIEDLLEKRASNPPTKGQIRGYLYLQIWRRACNESESPRHRFRRACGSLFQRNKDGDEYEVDMAESSLQCSAEDEFFANDDLENLKQYYSEALASLPEDLRICFLGRMNGIEYAEMAKELNISTNLAQQRVTRARKKISAFLKKMGVNL